MVGNMELDMDMDMGTGSMVLDDKMLHLIILQQNHLLILLQMELRRKISLHYGGAF